MGRAGFGGGRPCNAWRPAELYNKHETVQPASPRHRGSAQPRKASRVPGSRVEAPLALRPGPAWLRANGGEDTYAPGSAGDAVPGRVFTNAMVGPVTLALDLAGDLGVANEGNNNLVEFAKAQLAKPNPAPTVTISSYRGSINYPYSIDFDASGNLWVGGL